MEFDVDQWLPALPWDMSFLGMPGCCLLQSNQVFGLGTTAGVAGTIQFDYVVPFQPNLIGAHVYLDVRHACANPRDSVLFLVHDIKVSAFTEGVVQALGGSARVLAPWALGDADLEALSYQYSLPD